MSRRKPMAPRSTLRPRPKRPKRPNGGEGLSSFVPRADLALAGAIPGPVDTSDEDPRCWTVSGWLISEALDRIVEESQRQRVDGPERRPMQRAHGATIAALHQARVQIEKIEALQPGSWIGFEKTGSVLERIETWIQHLRRSREYLVQPGQGGAADVRPVRDLVTDALAATLRPAQIRRFVEAHPERWPTGSVEPAAVRQRQRRQRREPKA